MRTGIIFFKFCIRCNKKFKPDGRVQRVCNNCKLKSGGGVKKNNGKND